MEELKKMKILLAEDNWINQRIAKLTFGQWGGSIDIASNGQEAVDMYHQTKYDLIMMDLQMPVMDGLEATRQIRLFEQETGRLPRAYIVALTSNVVAEMEEVCLNAGMDGFLEKPFQEADIRKLLAKLFD
ncbi:MAG TPA: response regulator [Prolixibacteraceae bacterium]|jgi:CheY-like chemotaxis protein